MASLGYFVQALQYFGDIQVWIFMLSGLIVGFIFGLIPGISGMLALALILPFAFQMNPTLALTFMIAVLAVQFKGGLISAILINIPGTAGNSATLADGFPMTQKGEGGRALGAALTGSLTGSLLSVFMALILIPFILPLIMTLYSAEMFFIILMGLVCVGGLGTGSMIKGLISAGLGLLIAAVGYQPATAEARFTFGSLYLYDGVPIIPIVLGLFAIPEMVAAATEGGSIAKGGLNVKMGADVLRGMKDVLVHKMLVLRATVIGFIIGILPALGASAAAFISYAQAKQTSKHPEEFGKGAVEGVIAPETANAAKEAGDLLTTLALGIPGSDPYALILGAFIIWGIVPGPEMLTKHADLSLWLMITIIVSNIITISFALPLASFFAKIALVPSAVLVPLVLVLSFLGAYASKGMIEDVFILLACSVIGVAMKIFNYNRPALLLGYVLGALFEGYFFTALKISGPLFFLRPISLVLMAIIITMIVWEPIKSLIRHRKEAKA